MSGKHKIFKNNLNYNKGLDTPQNFSLFAIIWHMKVIVGNKNIKHIAFQLFFKHTWIFTLLTVYNT